MRKGFEQLSSRWRVMARKAKAVIVGIKFMLTVCMTIGSTDIPTSNRYGITSTERVLLFVMLVLPVRNFILVAKLIGHFSKKQRPVTRSEYSRAMSPSPFDRTGLPYFV